MSSSTAAARSWASCARSDERRSTIRASVLEKVRNFRALWRDEGGVAALRIARAKAALAWRRRRHGPGPVRHPVPALGMPMYLDLEDEGLSKTLFYRGVHEPLATAWVKREVEPGMTVVDVGANLGYYALLESVRTGASGRVYALEPVPTTYEILCRNLELNQADNVEPHCLALASIPGPMTMRLPRRRNWAHLPHPALSSERARRLAALPHREVSVEATALDAFVRDAGIRALHFLRMDIEGFEIEVVKGAMHTLSRHRPLKVLMELHPFLSDDGQPFEELVIALHEAGLAVRYLAQEEELVAEWPRLEEVLRYLGREPAAAAPHLLLEAVS